MSAIFGKYRQSKGAPIKSAQPCYANQLFIIIHPLNTTMQSALVSGYDRKLFFNVGVDVVAPTIKVLTALIQAHIEIATPIFYFKR